MGSTPSPGTMKRNQEQDSTSIDIAPETLWEQRGWIRKESGGKEIYTGGYLTTDQNGNQRSFNGRIEMRPTKHIQRVEGKLREVDTKIAEVFIAGLPKEIRRHPHGNCFHWVGSNWFHMNWWSLAPEHVDRAISYVEGVLAESFNPELLEESASSPRE